ncbi:MAG: DUF2127 domain-containing protein [Nitrospirota bacterium]|nr:DUF2127 domain-containing protein [Nitrospirota bacterium]
MITPHRPGLDCGVQTRERPLLLLVGLRLLKLVHAEIATLFSLLLEALHLDADFRILHALVLKVNARQLHSVLVMGVISLSYAGLLLAQGVGLWLEASWPAYVTVISTSLLLPFEVYEVLQRVSALRIWVLLLNLAIVVYLISQLKQPTVHSGSMVRAGVVGAQHD